MAQFEEIGLEAVLRNVGGYVGDAGKMVAANKAVTGSLGKATAAAGRFRDTAGKAIQRGALVAGAAVVALGGLATKMGADFQTAFTEVTTLFDASEEQIASLQKGVLQLSKDMGIDATEATRALYQAISAGVAPDNALTFLRENVKLAVGGVTDLATAVDLTTTVLNAFGLQGEELTRVMDTMFLAVVQGKTTIAELGASMFNVAGAAASSGVSIEETAAALATLAAAGTPTAQATTALRAAFIELGKEGTKANKAFQDIAGVGFRQFEKEGGNVVEAMELLRQKAEQDGVAVSDLFGSMEAGVEIGKLAGEQFETLSGNFGDMANKAGAVDGAFEKMNATFARQFSILKENIKVPLVELGLVILPALTAAAKKLGEELPKAIEAAKRVFEDWQPALKESIRLIAELGKAIRDFGGWIIANKIALTAAIIAIGAAFIWVNPLIAAIAGAGGLIIVIGLLRASVDELGESALRSRLKILQWLESILQVVDILQDGLIPGLNRIPGISDAVIFSMAKLTGVNLDADAALREVRDSIDETGRALSGVRAEFAATDLHARALAVGLSTTEAAAANATDPLGSLARAALQAKVALLESGKAAPTVAQAYRVIAIAALQAGESVEIFGRKLLLSTRIAQKGTLLQQAFIGGATPARLAAISAEIENLQKQLEAVVSVPTPDLGAAASAGAAVGEAVGTAVEEEIEEAIEEINLAWRRGAQQWVATLQEGIARGEIGVQNLIDLLEGWEPSGAVTLPMIETLFEMLVAEEARIAEIERILTDTVERGTVRLQDALRLYELNAEDLALDFLQALEGGFSQIAERIREASEALETVIVPNPFKILEGALEDLDTFFSTMVSNLNRQINELLSLPTVESAAAGVQLAELRLEEFDIIEQAQADREAREQEIADLIEQLAGEREEQIEDIAKLEEAADQARERRLEEIADLEEQLDAARNQERLVLDNLERQRDSAREAALEEEERLQDKLNDAKERGREAEKKLNDLRRQVERSDARVLPVTLRRKLEAAEAEKAASDAEIENIDNELTAAEAAHEAEMKRLDELIALVEYVSEREQEAIKDKIEAIKEASEAEQEAYEEEIERIKEIHKAEMERIQEQIDALEELRTENERNLEAIQDQIEALEREAELRRLERDLMEARAIAADATLKTEAEVIAQTEEWIDKIAEGTARLIEFSDAISDMLEQLHAGGISLAEVALLLAQMGFEDLAQQLLDALASGQHEFQRGGFIPAGQTVPAMLHGPEIVVPLGRQPDFSRLESILAGVSGGGAFRNYGSVNVFAATDADVSVIRSMRRALGA